jgi:hypothetical protein
LLDYIADLGGLAGALALAFRFIIVASQFQALHQFLTPYLYAISTKVEKHDRFLKIKKEGGDSSPENAMGNIPLALKLQAGIKKVLAG